LVARKTVVLGKGSPCEFRPALSNSGARDAKFHVQEQMRMITLQTERLLLLSLSLEDLGLALNRVDQLSSQLDVSLTADVFSDESRQAMMVKMTRMGHVEAAMHTWYTYFLIVQADNRCGVGVCGFKGAPSMSGAVEVGYAMHPQYRNRGYMTEAVQGLIVWAFKQDACLRVTAETLRDNFASQRVLQKAGMSMVHDAGQMLYWQIEKSQYLAARPPQTPA
jgi:[ribosomal protein S5]-alanine N-acetyltransferase